MLRKLLTEDDCAPDAYEYFAKAFENIVGMSVPKFKQTAATIGTAELSINWEGERYVLSYAADDPFYVLYEKE